MFATFRISTLTSLLAIASPLLVGADVDPILPSSRDKFDAGASCLIKWKGDTASKTIWKKMSIELMTGDNFNMVFLTTVATNRDGTVDGHFNYTCPEVTPYSAIYFYQLTSPVTSDIVWTTRFTIASPKGASVPPPNAIQPDGSAIPWGTGALINSTGSTTASGGLISSSLTPSSDASASANSAAAGSTMVSLTIATMALLLSL